MNKLLNMNLSIGKAISWLTLLMVIITMIIVVLRYGFNIGWIAVQESVNYMHATVFMLGIAYTMKKDAHVRVDIFYSKMGKVGQAKIDLIGHIVMLIPMCLFILYSSANYVYDSWQVLEQSRETGGLAFVYLLKSIIPIMAILLLLEAIFSSLQKIKIIKAGN